MADITSITFAFHGFLKTQELILQSYFANADKWDPPWQLTDKADDARVVIIHLSADQDYGQIEPLIRDLPTAEIIVFSTKKPEKAKWFLERQASGKPSIVEFSKLVLKISHALKRNKSKAPEPKPEPAPPIAEQPISTEAPPCPIPNKKEFVVEEIGVEEIDMSNFFNKLDSLMESKPNEKRKRFNES